MGNIVDPAKCAARSASFGRADDRRDTYHSFFFGLFFFLLTFLVLLFSNKLLNVLCEFIKGFKDLKVNRTPFKGKCS